MDLEALKKKILIADDDAELREAIKDSIELLAPQMRFIEAQDGQIALSKMRNEKFDLLIMDLAMPRLDGKGLLQSLTKLPKDHRPDYVLVLSGSLSGGQKRLGRVTYQGKPFQLEELKTFLIDCFSPRKTAPLPEIGEEGSAQAPAAGAPKDPGLELTRLFAEALQNALKKTGSQEATVQASSKSDDKSISCEAGASVISSCLAGGVKVQLVHSFSQAVSVQLAEVLTGEDESEGIEGVRAALVHLVETACAEAKTSLERLGQSVSAFTHAWSSSEAAFRVGFGNSQAIYRAEVQGAENLKIIIHLSIG